MRTATPADDDVRRARRLVERSSLRALAGVALRWPVNAILFVPFAWASADHASLIELLVASTATAWLTAVVTLVAARRTTGERLSRARWAVAAGLVSMGATLGLTPVAVHGPHPGSSVDFLAQSWVLLGATAMLLMATLPMTLFLALTGPACALDAALVLAHQTGLPTRAAPLAIAYLCCLVWGGRRQYSQLLHSLSVELTATRLVAEVGEANDRLEYRATHDPLTGLATRDAFLEAAQAALHDAAPGEVALLVIDVDRFKTVNEALGHSAGDRLLIEIADRLVTCLREADAAARHGGDEFTVLLTQVADEADARRVADRVRRELGRPLVVEGQRITTTVSIGVALNADPEDGAADLLRHADAARYLAKDAGRNHVAVFDQALRSSLRKRVSEETELRDALADGQIVAWFQPIVDMRTDALVGAEALARWLHPEHGVLLPARFLSLLEDAGLLPALSREMADQVFALRRDIEPLVPERFRITLNVGVRDQTLPTIVERLVHQARTASVAPTGIGLEITENAVIGDVPGATKAVAWARRNGFGVMLDDFGTGSSSLALLRDLQLDALKIDQSFVRRMAGSPADAAIVAGVLDLARRLHLYVVAEGVETEDDVRRLRRDGATFAQGFRYSPAVTPQEFLGLLTGRPPWIEDGLPTPPLGTAALLNDRHERAVSPDPEA